MSEAADNKENNENAGQSAIKVRFGTAGIRGLFGKEVSVRETIAVCFAVNQLLEGGRFGLGYDSRDTSFLLATVASCAFNWYGSNVENFGMIPTPVLAYSIRKMQLHAGLSVTASHNPPEYAGVKVFGTDGIEFSLEVEHKLEALIQKSSQYTKHIEQLANYGSTIETANAVQQYLGSLIDTARPTRKKFKILVDCANGTSINVTPKILFELGHKIITVNAHATKSFPGRLPEPMPETLEETGKLVRLIGADFGLAHDGDADRLVVIDSDGSVVPDYVICVLVLKIILEGVKRGPVIISYNSSDAIENVAKGAGCTVRRSRLGKTFEELYNRRGVFACEPSKMVDPRWGYWEDGIYAAVLITQYLSEKGIEFREAVKGIPKYYNYRKDLFVSSRLSYDVVQSNIMKEFSDSVEEIELDDGVKLHLKNNRGWLMLRSSGTENKVRIYSESTNDGTAIELLERGAMLGEISQTKNDNL